jgi:hypothetical protein
MAQRTRNARPVNHWLHTGRRGAGAPYICRDMTATTPTSAPRQHPAVRHFIDNIELWLSSIGIAVVFAAPVLLINRSNIEAGGRTDMAYWKVAGVTALIVGALHGVIFWLVRRRQRRIRHETLHDVRVMLADVVNSHLQVITLGLNRHPDLLTERKAIAKVDTAIRRITEAVDAVSVESLQAWREKYPNH